MNPETPPIEPRAGVTYRPDIDGLRGIAVLAVVLFHAFPAAVPSGFIGVDVFFVVSGYLITQIVLDDLERGRFTFAHFYARRVRRLFPSLLVVLVAVWMAGAMLFLDSEFRALSRHIAGAAAFAGNFVFWSESGYFATAAQGKPLLHLWSLGIEEQFYLVWPMVVAVAWKHPRRLAALVVVLGAASFLLNVHETRRDADAAFFLPGPRFWELLAGVFLAVAPRVPALNSALLRLAAHPHLRSIAAGAGVAAIVTGTIAIRDMRPFPGFWALLPVIATWIVIATGPDTVIHRRILGNPALVGVGLVSYALYLWHWPLLSFAHLTGDASPSVNAALVAASLALAWATWRWIERPIRSGRGLPRMKVAVLSVAMACVGITGILGNEGVVTTPRQLPSRAFTKELAWNYDRTPRLQPVQFGDADFPGAAKLRSDLARHPRYMVLRGTDSGNPRKALYVGDSHMEHYWPRVDQLILEKGAAARSAVFFTASGFLPIPGVETDPSTHPQFQGLARAMVDYALSDPAIDTVVISCFWGAHFAQGRGYVDTRDSPFFVTVDGLRQPIARGNAASGIAMGHLEEMIRTLGRAGKRVFLVQSGPGGPVRVVRKWSGPEVYAPPVRAGDALREGGELREQLSRAGRDAGAVVLDPFPSLCPGAQCPVTYEDGHPVYIDQEHFAERFARGHLQFIDATLLDD